MTDVIVKIISANPIKNNGVIVGITPGTYQSKYVGFSDDIEISGVETKLDSKFDDLTYYNG